jgi:acetyltransferase-like isoleucine patch superfamily enzyme
MAPDYNANVRFLRLGEDVQIGERTSISAINAPADDVRIGDNVYIGQDVRILAPRVTIGDYCTIHHHVTIYGYEEVVIGACTWIGQGAILNCTAPLHIGRGCTISAMANIWTHFSGGDPVEGCNFQRYKSCQLGEDVWVGVQASIAPVSIGQKALVMAGAVVTKNIPPNRTYGGNPAVDLTQKLGEPYTGRSVEEKFAAMCDKLREYHEHLRGAGAHRDSMLDDEFSAQERDGVFRLGGITIAATGCPEDGSSIFDVRDRTYSKLRTPEEIGFMHFLLPLVKFYPRG